MKTYYSDESVVLYHGDMREIISAIRPSADAIVTDPPYGETHLQWDRWPDGWPSIVSAVSSSMWCFGSMRMFLERHADFVAADWRLSQDVVWEKPVGTGFATDRFKRVHEHALHWYRGFWGDIYHATPRRAHYGPRHTHTVNNSGVDHRSAAGRAAHTGDIGPNAWNDDGTRLQESVLHVNNMRGRALHPTEKPVGILDPLIRYACPEGGTVFDPFAGSGSTGEAARMSGRRAILIESSEEYCDKIAQRFSQNILPLT